MVPVAPTGLLEALRQGAVPLETSRTVGASLRLAVVVPQFRRGSGGHATIAELVRGLEQRGHDLSVWVDDQDGRHAGESEAEVGRLFEDFFGPTEARVRSGLGAWTGADVVLATGWQTVPLVLRLPNVRGRAYLVQDHEPEFYPTSAERRWAEWTYRQGLQCICASPWLAQLVADRYGAAATSFDLGVDHGRYSRAESLRSDDLVLFYARAATARRAVPLGALALTELHRRRPGVRIALFGEAKPLATPFPHDHLGVREPAALRELYSTATVGLVLSLTNPSLVPTEMLACGLPVVDLASDSMLRTFGTAGPIALSEPDPIALCDALEALLDDRDGRAQRSASGIEYAARRTWAAAAASVEDGLRAALGA